LREKLPEPVVAATDSATETFIEDLFAPEDSVLAGIRRAMVERGLPTIQLPRITARTVQLLLGVLEAGRVVEVGTLAGYSALWIARALPAGGRLVSIELEEDRAELARALLDEAGVGDRVQVLVGDARRILTELGPESSWDAVFLDADKEGLPVYVQEARRLLRPGGLLLVDNALWKGRVVRNQVDDPATRSIRDTLHQVAGDMGFDTHLLPVGDGLLVGRRLDSD